MASNSSSATAQRSSAQIASRSRNRADSLLIIKNHRMPTVNERCKILRSLNRVYVFEIVLLLVPRLKILRGLSIGILDFGF